VGLREAQKYGSTGGKSSQFSVVSFKFRKRVKDKARVAQEAEKQRRGLSAIRYQRSGSERGVLSIQFSVLDFGEEKSETQREQRGRRGNGDSEGEFSPGRLQRGERRRGRENLPLRSGWRDWVT
jgi:hypothetical protein